MLNKAIKNALKAAVEHQAVCQVKIKSEGKTRNVHPYGLLQNAKGKYILVCWQEAGHSQSGKLPNFRNLPIDDVASLEITDGEFATAQQFNPTHKMYKNWEFKLAK